MFDDRNFIDEILELSIEAVDKEIMDTRQYVSNVAKMKLRLTIQLKKEISKFLN